MMQTQQQQQGNSQNKMNFIFGLVSGIAVISLVGFVTLLVRGGDGSGGSNVANTGGGGNQPGAEDNSGEPPGPTNVALAAVTEDDHIRGDIDAPVIIVEYSDFQCPFCKRHHPTVQAIVDEYGGDQVAWVFRHFPLRSIHPEAQGLAEASECAADQAGNDGFWTFSDAIFELASPTVAAARELAVEQGLEMAAYDACMDGGEQTDKVNKQYQDALSAGGQGTPYNVIIGPDDTEVPLAGAFPADSFREIIDGMLNN